ncbi:MAG: hypothetical protein H0V76_11280 [Blastocatellia bacterium]|nr:hypothetical protein [Blastocatellia bacterium]
MKKMILVALMLGMSVVFVPATYAKSSPVSYVEAAEQYRVQQRRSRVRQPRRGVRTYTTTRMVRRWGRLYRETIRVRVLPNGRRQTTVIRRVRIR